MRTSPRRQTWVWLVLLAATVLVTWAVTVLGLPVDAALTVTILVAGVKVVLVTFEYMELATAPRWVQVLALGWVAAVTAMILAFYLGSPLGVLVVVLLGAPLYLAVAWVSRSSSPGVTLTARR